MARTKMASIDLVLVMALMAFSLAELVAAQVPAPAPSEDCTTTLISLTPCLDYVMANDTKPPPKDCCTGLVQVVNENEICLCQLFGASNPFGLTINQTRAEAMPAVCKVETPPLSLCNAVGYPVSTPAFAPAPISGGLFAGPAGSPASPGSSPAATATAGNIVPSVGLSVALILAAFAQLAI